MASVVPPGLLLQGRRWEKVERMGQAKRRGTFEQRREAALARMQEHQVAVIGERFDSAGSAKPRTPVGQAALVSLMAAGIYQKPR